MSTAAELRPVETEAAAPAAGDDTFPKILIENAKRRGNRTASREKDLGIWQSWTWAEVLDEVRALACGLAAKGLQRFSEVRHSVIVTKILRIYPGAL